MTPRTILITGSVGQLGFELTRALAPHGNIAAFDHATLLARKLRTVGQRVYLDFDARSLKSQMRLAGKLKAKSVIIIGEEELNSGTVVLRDMSTKEQRNIKEEELL